MTSEILERAARIELATYTLATCRSSAELCPLPSAPDSKVDKSAQGYCLLCDGKPYDWGLCPLHLKRNKYLYGTWLAMKYRCTNPKRREYRHYGGRGISVCIEWLEDFEPFVKYIVGTLGERPLGHSLDRIDNDGDYRPGNVRWATRSQQMLNRRPCKRGPDLKPRRKRGCAKTVTL